MKFIKHYLLFIALSIIALKLSAQKAETYTEQQLRDYPYWFELMQAENPNYFAVKKAYDLYFETHKKEKGTGWKIFERWSFKVQNIVKPDGSLIPQSETFKAWQIYKSQKGTSGGYWREIGPVKYPVNTTGQPTGKGRLNAICFHPTNANTIWVGAPSGGLWKTTDNGASWTSNTDQMPSLGVSSILIDPVNTNTMYIGTGDRDAGDAAGLGVFKSTDGGNTWQQSNTGMGNVTVGDMIMNPANPQVILAATSGGIFKTLDGGANWTKKSTISGNYKDIEFKPGTPAIVYATAAGKFYRSANNGDTWTQITSGIATGSRMVLAVTPANPEVVYIFQTNSTFVGCFVSTDSGLNFTKQSADPVQNICGYTDGDAKSQAWYDLCLVADPQNVNILYAGTINIHKSTNGGQTWTKVAHWSTTVHADQHVMAFSPLNNMLYVGNDGGLYTTADAGANWTERSSNLGIAQIYKIGQSYLTREKVINGFQDNGTALYHNGTFSTIGGGDGMECIIDYSNDNYMYQTYISSISMSSDHGNSFSQIAALNVNGINEEGAWVTPYFLHKTNPNTMFVGYKSVWRSENVRNAPPVWTNISTDFGTPSSNITEMEQCDANNDILYIAKDNKTFYRSDNCNAATPVFTNLTANLPVAATVADIQTHPSDANIVYIILSEKIYKSTDKGLTWTSISGNLPASTGLNCMVYDKNSSEGIYLGTSSGVFYRNATMQDWIPFDNKLPYVDVRELEIYYGGTDTRIRAATYGRGLWESELYANPSLAPVANFESFATSAMQGESIIFKDISAYMPASWEWTISPSTISYINGTSATSQNPEIKFEAAGVYSVSLKVTNANGNNTKTIKSYITIHAKTTPACTPTTTTIGVYGIGIYNVLLNTINNSSSDTPENPATGYMDFYGKANTTLKPSTTYPLVIDAGHGNKAYVKVWIDYNNNASFEDAGELIYTSESTSNLHSTTFTTPASPVTNKLLRMRVMSDWGTIANSCTNPGYGQAEDYGVVFSTMDIKTNEVTDITPNSAVCSGTIVNQGASAITTRGIVYSTKTNPTLTNNTGYIESASTNSVFQVSVTGLISGQTYYVRAYAINNQELMYGNENQFVAKTIAPALSVTTNSLNINATQNSTATFDINSNISWTTASNQNWLTLNTNTGSGNMQITLTAQANPTINQRQATITVTGSGVSNQTITVTQAGAAPQLTVSVNNITLQAAANSTNTFDIKSNTDWTITGTPDWFSLNKTTGTGDATITVTAQANTTTNSRNAGITISGTNLTPQTVTVTQNGGTTGINNTGSDINFQIYPNPNKGKFTIVIENYPKGDYILTITNSIGEIIKETKITNTLSKNNYDFDLSNSAKGIYFIKIKSADINQVKQILIN